MNRFYINAINSAKSRGGQVLSSGYETAKAKMMWKCEKEHTWWMSYDNCVRRGSWCPYCSKHGVGGIVTLTQCKQVAESRGGECLSDEYVRSTVPLVWRCKNGHTWKAFFGNILHKKSWCPVCAGNSPKTERFMMELAKKNGGAFLSKGVDGVKKVYRWECGKKHQWEASADSVIQGHWCRICRNGGTSRPEIELLAFVQTHFDDAVGSGESHGVLRGNRRMTLDVWIPSKRKAIEFDGDYWHSTSQSKDRDSRKNLLCEEEKIDLLRIREKDWKRDKDSVLKRVYFFLTGDTEAGAARG